MTIKQIWLFLSLICLSLWMNDSVSYSQQIAGFEKNCKESGLPMVANRSEINWGSYSKKLHKAIRKHWHPTQNFSNTDTATFDFDVVSNGQLRGLFLTTSSGNKDFNKAASDTIQSALPLPALPKKLKGQCIHVQYVFNFLHW